MKVSQPGSRVKLELIQIWVIIRTTWRSSGMKNSHVSLLFPRNIEYIYIKVGQFRLFCMLIYRGTRDTFGSTN